MGLIFDAEVAEQRKPPSRPPRIDRPLGRTPSQGRSFFPLRVPVWQYHPFLTNTDLPVDQADITDCQHAIIETVSPI